MNEPDGPRCPAHTAMVLTAERGGWRCELCDRLVASYSEIPPPLPRLVPPAKDGPANPEVIPPPWMATGTDDSRGARTTGNQWARAIASYRTLLEQDPKDVRNLQKLGELLQKSGQQSEAAECFLKVGDGYAADGFFLKAVAVYKQVVKLEPELIATNVRLADLLEQLGLMSDAMAQHQLLADRYRKLGDTTSLLETLRKIVDLDPDAIAYRISLAELLVRMHRNPEAVEEFRRAAAYLRTNDRLDDYLKVARRLDFLSPGDAALTHELTELVQELLRGGRHEAAAVARLLATVHRAAGRSEEAAKVLAALERLEPSEE